MTPEEILEEVAASNLGKTSDELFKLAMEEYAQQEVAAYKKELASLKEENDELKKDMKYLLEALESLSPTVKK